ncbi:hypothetical protein D9611_012593 [Ephemerocybe angulata]|uniref:BTB domain-containing protein n=1 Tax=Ephemerocybe angulata TaxID=980116 RepID=A0A8H5AUW9_9AGAR|nr:hypothetical protein D9611_012593 [Tulosesus angulatus]
MSRRHTISDKTGRLPPSVPNCPIPVDLVLRSSDKVLIGAHKANLEHFSDGFPSADSVSDSDEPVDLSEDGATLKLLLSGMHKQRLPALIDLEVEELVALAEAGEKYFVYGMMAACTERIRAEARVVTDLETATTYFAYAVKFGYLEVADTVAPLMIHFNINNMYGYLKGYDVALLAWMRYREQFVNISDTLRQKWGVNAKVSACERWAAYSDETRKKLPQTVGACLGLLRGANFEPLEKIFDENRNTVVGCPCKDSCSLAAYQWMWGCKDMLSNAAPFSSFLTTK